MRSSHAALLGGVAMLTVASGTSTAQAQVQMPGFFGSVTGWYYFDSGSDGLRGWNVMRNESTGPDDGWGGRVYFGYRFSNPWDIAVGVQGSWLDKGENTYRNKYVFKATQKADYILADAEVGYSGASGSVGYRFFAGIRYAEFDHSLRNINLFFNDVWVSYDNEYWGVGPRAGVSFSARFSSNSDFSVFGDLSGSVLFGKLKGRARSFDASWISDEGSRTVWNVDGQLGIAYEVAPNVNIGVGYRAELWDKPADGRASLSGLTGPLTRGDSADRVMHGPFVRVSYNIGAPRPAPVAVAPAPAAVMTKNFIVFFDWDRADLSMQAKATISQAAAASKTGGVQRINVTGHADKSGTDAYNMAISLRRANAVRDDLVRNGVPANAIVVVARGETQPLVPTADGVREPQNRRVEIVLN